MLRVLPTIGAAASAAPSMGQARISLLRACELFELGRSTVYYARTLADPGSAPGAKALRKCAHRTALRDRIEELCLEFPCYGYRRVTAQLRREGRCANHKQVLHIMQVESLICHVRRAFKNTTDSSHGYRRYGNLIREMPVVRLNQVWVADITYIRLHKEFVYLAVILDSYSRRVVGWELSNTLESSLCLRAFERALEQRRPPAGLIHHSDQGVQYSCGVYVEALKAAGVLISMSSRGNPYENARAESFMKTLKKEEVYLNEGYQDLEDARKRLSHFLEDVYNQKRLHSSLGYLPPAEFERDLPTKSDGPASNRPAPRVPTSQEASAPASPSQDAPGK